MQNHLSFNSIGLSSYYSKLKGKSWEQLWYCGPPWRMQNFKLVHKSHSSFSMSGWIGKEENCRSWLHYRYFFLSVCRKVSWEIIFNCLWNCRVRKRFYFMKKLPLEFSQSLVVAINIKNEMVLVQERLKKIVAGVLQDLSMIWQDVLPTHPYLQLLCQAAIEICSLWKFWGFCECFWFVLGFGLPFFFPPFLF